METKSVAAAVALAIAVLTCAGVFAKDGPKIDRATAEKTALARVPGGQIRESELEKEHGKLVWSFDISRSTSADITEVQIDAMTGEVVAVEIETPADQAKESAKEKREKEAKSK
jgi:hypothetical protein